MTTLIAAISDVHSDFDSLLGVWKMIETETPPGRVVCNAGDTVAYGGDPERCVEFFRNRPDVLCVGGNYDEHVADFEQRHAHYRAKWGKKRPRKFEAIKRDSDAVSACSREWLANLPHQRSFDVSRQHVLLSHYAPGSRDEGLLVVTPYRRLVEIANATKARVVIVGHTHMAFVRHAAGTVFVNPGSVGRPWGAPSWALIEIQESGEVRAEIKRWRG